MDIFTVVLSKKAKDDLRAIPAHIARKVGTWIDSLAHDGLLVARFLNTPPHKSVSFLNCPPTPELSFPRRRETIPHVPRSLFNERF